MATVRRLITSFAKGELDPAVEGRPDLAAYFEGASRLENWTILKTGGIQRRNGSRFISEVKFPLSDTILLPFESSVTDAVIVELGAGYARFYKNKAQILSGTAPYEITAPYSEAQLRRIHFTQSVDVMFTFHQDVPQQRLSRVSDTNWAFAPTVYNPPPSFEADTDISGGAVVLQPAATTGAGVVFSASGGVFLAADVGRIIIAGTARARITAVTTAASLLCDILDAFPNTLPIPAGQWRLRLSPQTTLDPTAREPIGAYISLTAGADAFRLADYGKFISIYGGVVQITSINSPTNVSAVILSEMSGTETADPPAAVAGAWTLEVASWSPATGYPRTGEFFQGKLGQASTPSQKTTWWLSSPDDYARYALGVTATDALEYTMATRSLNQIEWMADAVSLLLGTNGSEHVAKTGKDGTPIGADNIPLVERVGTQGSAPMQPAIIDKRLFFVDGSRRLITQIAFNWEADGFDLTDITGAASHITESGIRLGFPAVQRRLFPVIHWIREDGQLIVLTFFEKEKVIGFARYVTDGTFESVAVIPKGSAPDEIWAIVKRTINGVTKRYVEVFDGDCPELVARTWRSLQTDCAKVLPLAGTTTAISGLGHLEGKLVDVIADGNYIGQQTVASGQISLTQPAKRHVEVGLHYGSVGATMRPAVDGQMVEGLPRAWNELFARVRNTRGGRVNGTDLRYPAQLQPQTLFTGDLLVNPLPGGDTDQRITFEQHLPYPMTLLALFGDITFGS